MTRRPRPPAPRVPVNVLAAIAVGGALGAVARYAVGLAWPSAAGGFPWSTFAINVAGCFAIGVLLVALTEGSGPPHPLARPFLGTGLLGGFTTFSAYAVQAERLFALGVPGTAFAYVLGTLVAAVLATQGGAWSARAAAGTAARRHVEQVSGRAATRTSGRRRSP